MMSRSSVVSAAVVMVLLAAGCGIDIPIDFLRNPATGASVLQTERAGLVLVKADVNGKVATILIDTGAPFGITAADRIEPLGLSLTTLNPFAVGAAASDACAGSLPASPFLFDAAQLTLGGSEFANVPFMVLDRFPPELVELGVDAILGSSIMNQFDWEVTNLGQTLTLHPAGTLERPASAAPLVVADFELDVLGVRIGAMVVPGRIEGLELAMVIDTGYTGAIGTTQVVAGLTGLENPLFPRVALPIASWSTICIGHSVRGPMATIAERTYDDVRVDVLPISPTDTLTGYYGLVGWGFIAAHHTRCSPRGGWIDFGLTDDTLDLLEEPLPDFGFVTLRREDGRLDVRLVVPDSPAEDAGLLEGDTIVRINGESVVGVSVFDLIQLTPESGATVELDVERGEQSLTIVVTASAGI